MAPTLFYTQEEWQACGSPALPELQFCRLPAHTALQELVAVEHICHRQACSLYIADEADFCRIYGRIFTGGVYNNLHSGPADLYGINYYPPAAARQIHRRILAEQPQNCDGLLAWLQQAQAYHGFYLLGI